MVVRKRVRSKCLRSAPEGDNPDCAFVQHSYSSADGASRTLGDSGSLRMWVNNRNRPWEARALVLAQ